MATGKHKKNPLKSNPLRQAGQSADEQRNRIIDDDIMSLAVLSLFVILLAALEWYRWWADLPPRPDLLTAVAVIVVGYSIWKIRRLIREARSWRLGRDGERAVGEFLERLRANGSIIFHDIVADTFNVDHVILSSRGIFVIETKTFSKPFSDARVRSDGHSLSCDGLGDKSEIIDQGKSIAAWIAEMLKESTGKTFPTRPVIVFPGWYVDGGLHKDYWVISPKALPKLLQGEHERLRPEDVKLAAYHLSRYIRATA